MTTDHVNNDLTEEGGFVKVHRYAEIAPLNGLSIAAPPTVCTMPPCPECQRPFFTLHGMRDHRRAMHALHECGLCGKQGLSSGGLLAHARTKHPKKFTKLFYSCKACDYYTVDGETLRLHYQTSPNHRKCVTCEEPYWDLPVFETLVMYKRLRRDLRRCDDCGRLTLFDTQTPSATPDGGDPDAPSEPSDAASEGREMSDGYATADEEGTANGSDATNA